MSRGRRLSKAIPNRMFIIKPLITFDTFVCEGHRKLVIWGSKRLAHVIFGQQAELTSKLFVKTFANTMGLCWEV